MGGTIIFLVLFGQNYILEQQDNQSWSCDNVSSIKLLQKSFIWSEHAQLYEKDQKEIQNIIVETATYRLD